MLTTWLAGQRHEDAAVADLRREPNLGSPTAGADQRFQGHLMSLGDRQQ